MPPIAPATEEETAASEAWQAAADKIRSFATLKPNWDFDGGHAPSQLDIDNAAHALKSIQTDTEKPPHISAAGDGEIGLEWTLENEGYIDISLHNGKLICISRTADGMGFDDEYEYKREIGVKAHIKRLLQNET